MDETRQYVIFFGPLRFICS